MIFLVFPMMVVMLVFVYQLFTSEDPPIEYEEEIPEYYGIEHERALKDAERSMEELTKTQLDFTRRLMNSGIAPHRFINSLSLLTYESAKASQLLKEYAKEVREMKND